MFKSYKWYKHFNSRVKLKHMYRQNIRDACPDKKSRDKTNFGFIIHGVNFKKGNEMTILVKIPQIWVKIWQMSSNPPPQAYTFILSVKNQKQNVNLNTEKLRCSINSQAWGWQRTTILSHFPTPSIQCIYYFETLTFRDSMQLLPLPPPLATLLARTSTSKVPTERTSG